MEEIKHRDMNMKIVDAAILQLCSLDMMVRDTVRVSLGQAGLELDKRH